MYIILTSLDFDLLKVILERLFPFLIILYLIKPWFLEVKKTHVAREVSNAKICQNQG